MEIKEDLNEMQEECEDSEQEAKSEEPNPDSEASGQDTQDSDQKDAEQTEPENEQTGAEDSEEKPKKKERRIKWAKSSEKTDNDQTNAIEEKLREAGEKYARLFAEFDNFRKRSEKEKAQRYDFGAKDMVERILPVIDNFERGLAAAQDKEDSFVKGMEMTYKQLLKTLEDAGVKPIEAVGQEFNPDFHNAVMHVDDPDAGENVIVEEFQKGYMYKDHVVRYSMVKVAN